METGFRSRFQDPKLAVHFKDKNKGNTEENLLQPSFKTQNHFAQYKAITFV